jgi:ADP-heptose:LPS heptosyltransferase
MMDIRWEMVPYTRGTGIQLNPKDEKYFPHFIGCGAEKLRYLAGNTYDFAVVDDLTGTSLDEVWTKIRPGGHLVITAPVEEPPPGSWVEILGNWVPNMWVYQRTTNGVNTATLRARNAAKKTAGVVRFGAVGDMIQTSSVLRQLKADGYHVTLFCHSGSSYDVIREDPSVDEFVIQDVDQVPNEQLGEYWTYLSKQFDKFVNLSGSVESTWLALEHTYPFYWPHEVRHKYLNENYLEFMHTLAGVPFVPSPKFFSTEKERRRVQQWKKKIGGKVLLWALAGSSVHKWWPHTDAVVARLMIEHPDWHVVFVGDELCKILEVGWEKESRVHRRSGVWSYRQSLTFAVEQADVVIGPETGVLNAVSHEQVPKLVFLSHSSHNNLTRDWVNVYPLTPEKTPCYPCHMLHTNELWCEKDKETGASLCSANTSAHQVWAVLDKVIKDGRSNS